MPKIVDKPAMQARILNAAATVFAASGFHAAKMSDVAKTADLAKGTLYLYFPSKDALITALVESFFVDTGAALESQKAPKTLNEFVAGIEILLSQSPAKNDRMQLFGKIFWLALDDDNVRQPIQHFRNALVARFSDHIANLINNGEFRPQDPDKAAETLVAMLDGVLLHQVLFDSYQDGGATIATFLHAAFSPV